jgi:hypothetical protein
MEPEKINHPYLTAIKRTSLSVPTRYLLQHNLLKGRILVHIPEHTRSLSGSLLGYKTIP